MRGVVGQAGESRWVRSPTSERVTHWRTFMHKKLFVLSSVALMLASTAYAAGAAGCDDSLTTSLQECQRIVGSLRADKAGQMRVFASDGSEFTAGQAQWMWAEVPTSEFRII